MEQQFECKHENILETRPPRKYLSYVIKNGEMNSENNSKFAHSILSFD